MNESLLLASSLIDPQIQANFHIESSIKHTHPLHYHDYYEFFIITAGSCIHKVNDEIQYLEKGAMVFIRPYDRHCYDFHDTADCQFINVNFYKNIVEDAFDYFENSLFIQNLKTVQLPPIIVLQPTEMDAFIKKCEQLLLYTTIDKLKARFLAKGILIDALTFLYINHQNENTKLFPIWFDSLLFQMQKKENFTVGLEKLHSISNKSIGHLNRVFKQYLHTTPTEYINHLRLNYAKNLLLTTNLSILEVSYEAGFENLSHFYHLFKESFGVSPGKIRSK